MVSKKTVSKTYLCGENNMIEVGILTWHDFQHKSYMLLVGKCPICGLKA